VVDNTRGILAMSAAVVVFIFNDALIKLAAESVPAVQAIGVRGLFATLWCALALLVTGAWRKLRWAGAVFDWHASADCDLADAPAKFAGASSIKDRRQGRYQDGVQIPFRRATR